MPQRLKLLLCYQGTRYHGWQIQEQEASPRTIQGVLEEAFYRLTGKNVRLTASGRTDAGVHALGQVAHCDVPPCSIQNWQMSLNAVLPKDIRVLSAEEVPQEFHARFSAQHKTYLFAFWTERRFVPPHRAPFVWACGDLDLDPMRAFLPYLVGEHDFASLQNTGSNVRSTIRRILEADLILLPHNPYLPGHAPEFCFKVTATGFLKQMVRNICGILAALGKHRLTVDAACAILHEKQRAANPCRTAPAQGLTLACVSYDAFTP